MTAAGLLDQLVGLIPSRPPSAVSARKAVDGPGYWSSLINPPLSAFQRDPRRQARLAQDVYISNRHVRQAERLISQRFATVDWHLEDGDGTRIGREEGDQSAPEYLTVLDLLERPYTPKPGDPVAAVPRTRATLWNVTCRHQGLAGYGFWYLDEAEEYAGTPRQLLYINPARLDPVRDASGGLVGWLLDPDARGGGTPLDTRHVITFHLEPPDAGHLGTGLVETAMSMVDLTRYADRHAQGVLAAGGRLAGVVSPKGDGTMEEDVYKQLVLDFRNAAEDPASARRTNILRGPVEFNRLSATPEELDLVAVMNLSRDEVRELWNVPRSQVGGESAAGLNSGSAKGYDEAVLWQNAVGPRLRSFAETLQFELLDRYADLGLTIRLVIEEPEFDDETPMYERASKATTQPLTNRERRELLGMEPFGDERDEEVWLASSMSRVYPEAETPPQLLPFTDQQAPPERVEQEPEEDTEEPLADAVKASLSDVRARARSAIERDLAELLTRYGKAVTERIQERASHLAAKPGDVDAVFSADRMSRDLLAVLQPHLHAVAEGAGGSVALRFGKAELRDVTLERLLRSAGVRVKGIAETTRDTLRDTISKGIADGLSMAELGDRIEASGVFGEARAETIARTETGTMLNQAAIAQYGEFGVEQVRVEDGDDDEPCADADGQVWTLAEAEASPLAHPNCVRTFTPMVGKAEPMDPAEMARLLEEEMNQKVADALTMQGAAIAELARAMAGRPEPVINVPAPIVTVQAPTVEPHVTVEAVPDRPRVFVVQRGPDGRVARIIEG